jgi:predicted nucleic acid-binding protein
VLELPFSTLKASAPVLANPLNVGKATMLTRQQFRYAFTNTISEEKSDELYERYAVPCANRVLSKERSKILLRTRLQRSTRRATVRRYY